MILRKIHDRIQNGLAVFVLGVGALFCVFAVMLGLASVLLGAVAFFGGLE
jgi:hypothetical protein